MGKSHPTTNVTLATLAGGAAGAVYFWIGEGDQSKDTNATYLSPVSTDIAAWLFGAVLVLKAYQHKDPLIGFIGSAIVSIHVGQWAAHKVIKNRIGLPSQTSQALPSNTVSMTGGV